MAIKCALTVFIDEKKNEALTWIKLKFGRYKQFCMFYWNMATECEFNGFIDEFR